MTIRLTYRGNAGVRITAVAVRDTVRRRHLGMGEPKPVTSCQDFFAMLLQMIDQLNAQRIPGEKTLDLDEKMHGFAQTLLETQPVVFRRGRGDSRMRDAIHAVLGMHRVYRRHCRVFRFLSKTLKMLHVPNCHLDNFCLLYSSSTLLQILGRYQSAQIGQTIIHAISSPFLDDPMGHWILLLVQTTSLPQRRRLRYRIDLTVRRIILHIQNVVHAMRHHRVPK